MDKGNALICLYTILHHRMIHNSLIYTYVALQMFQYVAEWVSMGY